MLIFLLQYWSFFKFISKNKLFSLNIISGSIMAAHARIFNTISCTWSMIIPRNIFYIFFLLSTIYSCPRRCAYTILGTFCVYICTAYCTTQHLDRFYGCCCENKVWHWVLFHTPHPKGSRTHHLWDLFGQHLVLVFNFVLVSCLQK